MTLDDLIKEGETFQIKHQQGYVENVGYGLIKQVSGYSYLPNADKFGVWIQHCVRYLTQNFPGDIAIEDFKNVQIEDLKQGTIYKLVGVLKALKENPIICPVAKPSNMNNITINQNLTQNQTQTFNAVLNSLKDELRGKEFDEIEKILSSNSPKEEKKKSIIEKLKSFGENVAAGVVASILTNGF